MTSGESNEQGTRRHAKRYIAYIRVGSDEQVKAGFEAAQKARLDGYAAHAGGEIVACWTFYGSAIDDAHESSLDSLIKFAREYRGELDGLLVCGDDRLARNFSTRVKVMELEDHGIPIISVGNVEMATESEGHREEPDDC